MTDMKKRACQTITHPNVNQQMESFSLPQPAALIERLNCMENVNSKLTNQEEVLARLIERIKSI